MLPSRIRTAWLCCLLLTGGVLAEAPYVPPAEDVNHLGTQAASLFWTPKQQVAGYRNWDRIFPTRSIAAGGKLLPLPEKLMDLDALELRAGDRSLTVDAYFRQQSVAGLLVIKNGSIVYERYRLGNTAASRWVSFSVAKSVTSISIKLSLTGVPRIIHEILSIALNRFASQ